MNNGMNLSAGTGMGMNVASTNRASCDANNAECNIDFLPITDITEITGKNISSRIAGTGSYLPQQVLTNYELEKRVDTTHAWIVERTGIMQRHIASASETTKTMGAQAAQAAIDAAGISAKDIDLIVVATCTPDKIFPSTACLIQQQLEIPPGPAFDVQAACSGFMYAFSIADQFIRTGTVKHALVIGSEVMSRVLDWNDRKTCVLFGDGAGAVVLSATHETAPAHSSAQTSAQTSSQALAHAPVPASALAPSSTPRVLSTAISADGRQKDILYLNNARLNPEDPDIYLQMQGNAVFRIAVNMLDQEAEAIVDKNRLKLSDIDWLVPHQANIRIIQATAEKLKIPMERVAVTLQNHGNTSAASIPLTLDTYIRQGHIKRGQLLLLEAIGGGLTWGTALVRY